MTEVWSNIPIIARYFLIAWVVLFILSFVLFVRQNKFFLLTMAICVFSIASAFALSTPFLFRWDEQFHALVGKNLASNPFHPILIDIDPSLWFFEEWSNTHTWLHKQPLFLYQIALSIKLFGATVYAVRLPSVVLHVMGTLVIFDMGKMMLNRNLGFLAAMIFSTAAFPLGLLSGRIGTDHNDSVFMIYVLLSFWAWFKFYTSSEKKWVKWIGIFVGCAILTKWLVGLLIFAPWGFGLAIGKLQNKQVDLRSFLKALGISLLISMPWQIYIFLRFPKAAKYEMEFNGRHFFEVLEGHPGDWYFHFQFSDKLFFNHWMIVVILLISSLFVFFASKKTKILWGTLLFSSALVYIFFSLAATKMGSFVAPVFPLMMLLLVFPFAFLLDYMKNRYVSGTLLLLALIAGTIVFLRPLETADELGLNPKVEGYTVREIMNQQWKFFENHNLNHPNQLVINAHLRGHGSVSWNFVNETKAISSIPSEESIENLQKAGYTIFCIDWQFADPIPEYIRKNPQIHYIPFQ